MVHREAYYLLKSDDNVIWSLLDEYQKSQIELSLYSKLKKLLSYSNGKMLDLFYSILHYDKHSVFKRSVWQIY